jgi:exosortase family protein XrtF
MNWTRLKEFKPTIFFLLKFVGLYLVLNVFYGMYVTSFNPRPDPVTRWVTEQTGALLSWVNHPTQTIHQLKKATSTIRHHGHAIVSVYEGCNGVNIVIIFISFLFAFGPYIRKMIWFIPLGILIIHFFNLVRIAGLFLITLYKPQWTYFLHKYLFTAFIYVVVFLLWFWWVNQYSKIHHEPK